MTGVAKPSTPEGDSNRSSSATGAMETATSNASSPQHEPEGQVDAGAAADLAFVEGAIGLSDTPEPIIVELPQELKDDTLADDVADGESNEDHSLGGELITFHWGPFWRQLFYHTFNPISMPFMYWWEGPAMMENQGFIGSNIGLMALNYVTQLLFLIITIVYFYRVYDPDAPQSEVNVTLSEVVVAIACHLCRYFMIAIKYAFMSDSWRNTLRARVLESAEFTKFLLIAGWGNPDPRLLKRELEIAEIRTGLNLREMSFMTSEVKVASRFVSRRGSVAMDIGKSSTLSPPGLPSLVHQDGKGPGKGVTPYTSGDARTLTAVDMNHVRSSLNKVHRRARRATLVKLDDNASHPFSAYHLCYRIIHDAFVGLQLSRRIGLLSALVICLSPLVVRWIDRRTIVGETWEEVLVTLLTLILGAGMLGSMFQFLYVAVYDYRRRARMFQTLGHCIDYSAPHSTVPDITHQMIDPSVPHNVSNWKKCHIVIQMFGREYLKRIQLYASASLVIMLALCVIVILRLLQGRTDFDVVTTVFSVAITIHIAVLISLMISYGTMTNQSFIVHQSLLVVAKTKLHHQLAHLKGQTDLTPEQISHIHKLDAAVDLLTSAQQSLAYDAELTPVKILGARADKSLLRGVFSVIATLGAVFLNYLSNRQSSTPSPL